MTQILFFCPFCSSYPDAIFILISTDTKRTKTLDLNLSPSTDTYPEQRANDERQAFQSFRNLTEEGYLLNNGIFKIDTQSFAVTFSGKQGYTYKIFHDFSESYVHDDYLLDPIIWVDHQASYTLRADSIAINGIDWWIDKHIRK